MTLHQQRPQQLVIFALNSTFVCTCLLGLFYCLLIYDANSLRMIAMIHLRYIDRSCYVDI